MRHLILTLLITLSFLPSRHHITHPGVFKYDIYAECYQERLGQFFSESHCWPYLGKIG